MVNAWSDGLHDPTAAKWTGVKAQLPPTPTPHPAKPELQSPGMIRRIAFGDHRSVSDWLHCRSIIRRVAIYCSELAERVERASWMACILKISIKQHRSFRGDKSCRASVMGGVPCAGVRRYAFHHRWNP